EEGIVAILEQSSRGRCARDSQEAVAIGRSGERQTVAERLELIAVWGPAVALLKPEALLRQQPVKLRIDGVLVLGGAVAVGAFLVGLGHLQRAPRLSPRRVLQPDTHPSIVR